MLDINAYSEAIDEIKRFLESLSPNYELENISMSITSRIKSTDSINNKLSKKSYSSNDDIIISDVIHDVAGVRCIFSYSEHVSCVKDLSDFIDRIVNEFTNDNDYNICSFDNMYNDFITIFNYYCSDNFIQNYSIDSIYKFINLVKESDYEIVKEKNYFESPKQSGYRGYHIVVKTSNNINVEIQFRTFLQHIWSELEHKFIYKYKTLGFDEVPQKFSIFFKNMASYIEHISCTENVHCSYDDFLSGNSVTYS